MKRTLLLVVLAGCSSGGSGGNGGGAAAGGGTATGGGGGADAGMGGGGDDTGGGDGFGGGSDVGGGGTGPGGGFAAGMFSSKHDFPTASSPNSVVLADFNGDGLPDIAAACPGNVSVLVSTYAGDGGATITFAPHADFPVGMGPNPLLTAADINGDGLPDIAVANGGVASVSVLLNTTAPDASVPSFAAPINLATAGNARAVAIGDFNGDGTLDVAAASFDPDAGTQALTIFVNLADAGARVPAFDMGTQFPLSGPPHDMAAADFNQDGFPDLVVVSATSATSVLLNQTGFNAVTPVFSSPMPVGSSSGAGAVRIVDINFDGAPDLVLASTTDGLVLILNETLPNSGTLDFSGLATFAGGELNYWVAAGDLDGDGGPDFALTEVTSSALLLYRNLTPVQGSAPVVADVFSSLVTAPEPWSVVIGALRPGAHNDIVVANGGADSVSVFLNQ